MSKYNLLFALFFVINIFETIRAQILSDEINDNNNNNSCICLTKTCVSEAANLMNTIDESVSPCDDFYQFSCGKWIQNRKLNKAIINRFYDMQDDLNTKLRDLITRKDTSTESPEFVRKVREYYESCTNKSRLEELGDQPLRDLIEQLGGWPLVQQNNWYELDWTDMTSRLRQLGLTAPLFFKITVTPDLMNATRRILTIDQPSFKSNDNNKEDVLNAKHDPSVQAYINLMVKTAIKLGAKDVKEVEKTFTDFLLFESLMINNVMPYSMRQNTTANYNKVTMTHLIDLAPNINWQKILKDFASKGVSEDEEIVLYDKQYIKSLNNFLPNYSNRFLADYAIWRVIKSKMSALNKEWYQLKDRFKYVLTGKKVKSRGSRADRCMKKTLSTFGIALSHLYVKNYFNEQDKLKASEIFKNIVKAFRNSLESNTWMANETKEESLKKIDSMKLLVGYPTDLMDESIVNQYYESLQIDSMDFFGNNGRITKWINDLMFNKLREPIDPLDWREGSSMAAVNAFYNPEKNLVEIPAGILQDYFFSSDRPNYLNYGSIGFMSAHEIIHGFDSIGKQYNADGNEMNWWDNTTDQLYAEKSQCFVNQYNNYKLNETVLIINLNGINALGENIADNGGINLAYKAYMNYVEENGPESRLPSLDYTPEQLFWISYGAQWCSKANNDYWKLLVLTDPHSPNRARANLVVSNSEEFSKAFNCHSESPMNPVNKCSIW